MTTGLVRSIVASDGYQLHFRYWPSTNVRGVVVALHGIQSHSGWYEYSATSMASAGFPVYFADRRGSGLNAVDRGHADHGERLIHDVGQLLRLARQEQPTTDGEKTRQPPLTLLGISWGGKTAAAVAAVAGSEVDRLALLYPGIETALRPSPWQQLQLRLARHWDIRRRMVPIPLRDPSLFTADPEWQKRIREDARALHQVTSGFLNAGRDLDAIIRRQASQITQPTLLMLAGRDQIIDNAATRARVAEFGCRHLTMLTYPEASHTLEFDACRDESVRDLLQWLSSEIH